MSDNEDTDSGYNRLQQSQRLKASLHYGVVSMCKEKEDGLDVNFNRQMMAAIAETTWRQCQHFAQDLELFAKHAKRSTINPDDVKLLVRKAPKLLDHISALHDKQMEGKQPKKPRKKKLKDATDINDNEDSNM